MYKHTDIFTYKHTDKQTDNQKDKHTDKQTDNHTSKHTHRQTHKKADRQTHRKKTEENNIINNFSKIHHAAHQRLTTMIFARSLLYYEPHATNYSLLLH